MQMATSCITFFPFPKQALIFMCLQYKSLENTVGKGEIASHLVNLQPVSSNLKLSSANPFNLEESKICCLGQAQSGV